MLLLIRHGLKISHHIKLQTRAKVRVLTKIISFPDQRRIPKTDNTSNLFIMDGLVVTVGGVVKNVLIFKNTLKQILRRCHLKLKSKHKLTKFFIISK